MSTNKLDIHPGKAKEGASNPLDTLVAKKDLEQVANQESFDLASASIQNTDIMRATPRKAERRSVVSTPSLASKQAHQEKQVRSVPLKHGLFKNPLFKYERGLINKLLSFFANLLKVIEQFALGALGSSAQSVFFSPSSNTRAKKDLSPDTEEEQQKQEQELKQGQNKPQLTIKRS